MNFVKDFTSAPSAWNLLSLLPHHGRPERASIAAMMQEAGPLMEQDKHLETETALDLTLKELGEEKWISQVQMGIIHPFSAVSLNLWEIPQFRIVLIFMEDGLIPLAPSSRQNGIHRVERR